MTRTEMMAVVALAAGLSLTVAEIATTDADASSLISKAFGPLTVPGLSGSADAGDKLDLLDPYDGGLREAYW